MQEADGQTESRTERFRVRASRRRKVALVVAAVVVATLAVGAVTWRFVHVSASSADATARVSSTVASAAPVVVPSEPATTPVARVEVPGLVGMNVVEAGTVLKAAGLEMRVAAEGTAASASDAVVRTQLPEAGTVTTAGAVVTIVVPTPLARAAATKHSATPRVVSGHFVVVIDPGHQSHADATPEAIGPGSAEQKPRMTAGVTGVSSQVPEYEVDLEISTNLQRRLEDAGVRVVMTRTTNDVNLSNVERAQIANTSKADLFVRVHTDSSPDGSIAGVSTLYPAMNQWTKPIVARSRRAASEVQQHLVAATGAVDGGSVPRSDIAGFNWSKVPAVLVQTGFQSNPVEDRLLASPHYQDEVAQGMADGILAYLRGARAR